MPKRPWYALLASNGLSLLLFAFRVVDTGSWWFIFLIWNLLLAWIPFGLIWWLTSRLKRTTWLTVSNMLLTVLWLGFLPNSFYVVTDFIHIGKIDHTLHGLVMDVAMIFSFTFNAYVVGFWSLYLGHRIMLRRLSQPWTHVLIGIVLLACSFAIYLGRTLRWNTWDIIINPIKLLSDIFHRISHVSSYIDMVATTVVFFLILSSMYILIWQFLRWMQDVRPKNLV